MDGQIDGQIDGHGLHIQCFFFSKELQKYKLSLPLTTKIVSLCMCKQAEAMFISYLHHCH
jgi:hypothetical protein